MRFCTLLLLAVCSAIGGCGGSAETSFSDPYALSDRRLHAAYERLTAPAPDSVSMSSRTRFAVRRMREYGLMPAFASGFQPPYGSRDGVPASSYAHVLGYVPGRDPSHADTLVLVQADLNTPGAAAVLETARRLALEALDAQVPERTVLFALWGPPRTGVVGLNDYLDRPTWGLDGLAHVLVVASDPETVRTVSAAVDATGLAHSALVYEEPQAAGPRPEPATRRQALVAFAEMLHDRVHALSVAAPALRFEEQR